MNEDRACFDEKLDPDFPPEARETLVYGAEREGYWMSKKFMAQIEKV